MSKIPCPNCGMQCEVIIEEDTGRKLGYCDPANKEGEKIGCDTSFELKKGKAKSSDAAKGLFVQLTENICYLEKRVGELETTVKGKPAVKHSLTPWSV